MLYFMPIACTGLYVAWLDKDLEDVKKTAMDDMKSVMSSRVDKGGILVYVQAATLGSAGVFEVPSGKYSCWKYRLGPII